MPQLYEILELVAKGRSPVNWNGKEWIPNSDPLGIGVSVEELIAEFKDPVFISRALDELLESGLLRSRDLPVQTDSSTFVRMLLPGGEHNARKY
jgi:hypothetical protein